MSAIGSVLRMPLWRGLLVLLAWLTAMPSFATRDYALSPKQVAENVYVFVGRTEHFSFANGGNIVNTGFIVGDDGVIVIDTGPSRLYAEQMRAAIGRVTDKPVTRVFISHFHPDHFLGSQAYRDVPLQALPETVQGIREQGELFNDAMYRLVGPWMKGTIVEVPQELDANNEINVAGRPLQLLRLSGHSGSDLAVFDRKSGVLFAGDSVFFERTPTTPHADVAVWLRELDNLKRIRFKVLVPGHGPVVRDTRAIEQTSAYLTWLQRSLASLAERGVSMAEALQPQSSGTAFFDLAVFAEEYQRSVAHLYPAMEQQAIGLGRIEQTAP